MLINVNNDIKVVTIKLVISADNLHCSTSKIISAISKLKLTPSTDVTVAVNSGCIAAT